MTKLRHDFGVRALLATMLVLGLIGLVAMVYVLSRNAMAAASVGGTVGTLAGIAVRDYFQGSKDRDERPKV